MTDKIASNAHAVAARKHLVDVAEAMLNGRASFFEGARVVCELRTRIGGISASDEDFNVFAMIYSETNYLPYADQRHVWNLRVLEVLEEYFEKTQKWAASFASENCDSLLRRFEQEDESNLKPAQRKAHR